MNLFKVTKEVVYKLLSLIDGGLTDGAGEKESATFCVQQAVSLATGQPDQDDGPRCVMEWLTNLGIQLNDSPHWESEESRAAGLREFAVAELGSNTIRERSFRRRLAEKMKSKWPERWDAQVSGQYSDVGTAQYVDMAEDEEDLKTLASTVVEILREMGSPGCEYLCLADKKYPRPDELLGKRLPQITPASEKQREQAWYGEDFRIRGF